MRINTRTVVLCLIGALSFLFCIESSQKRQDSSERAVGAQPPSKINISAKDPRSFLPKGVEPSAGCTRCIPSITFRSKQAKQYQIGTNIPFLPFKTKQSWGGRIPIPDTPTAKGASIFFWLWGKDSIQAGNDLVIWMNGGPGCNSLVGLLTENGPFIFQTDKAQPNPYSWTKAANILYIAQPVGVSFATGTASNSNEFQISNQFTLFLIEFFKIFPELASFNIWLTGESYMGQSAGYFIDAIKKNPQTQHLSFKGGMLVSPLLSNIETQLEVPAYSFAKQNQNALKISSKGLARIQAESKKCKLATFLRTYLTYPPRGRLPSPSEGCSPFSKYVALTVDRDPKFNIYNIKNPILQPSNQPTAVEVFLNRASVQDYIHAPRQRFQICVDVFKPGNIDQSESVDRYPSFKHSLLAQMFEKSSKFFIMSGMLDGLLFTQGVQLAFQNLTWNGAQGFQKSATTQTFYDMEGKKRAFGTEEERNVRLIIVPEAGHMIPRDEPSLSLSALNALLGNEQWFLKK